MYRSDFTLHVIQKYPYLAAPILCHHVFWQGKALYSNHQATRCLKLAKGQAQGTTKAMNCLKPNMCVPYLIRNILSVNLW
jgi:hypothetical protein